MKRQIFFLELALMIIMTFTLSAQQRIVLAGRGANMLADAIYLFPDAGERLVAYSSGDQGLGLFMWQSIRLSRKRSALTRVLG